MLFRSGTEQRWAGNVDGMFVHRMMHDDMNDGDKKGVMVESADNAWIVGRLVG